MTKVPTGKKVLSRLSHKQATTLFDKLSAGNPKPTTELIYQSHFELLVSVMLSAQATDQSVNKATTVLFKEHNTPEALLKLGEKKLLSYVRRIGLAPTKSKNVIATSKLLIETHQGQVPNTREALEALPGVGRKTANVVLNVAFGEPTIAVDTHVFRLANRTGLASGKTTLEVEKQLLQITPKKHLAYAHHLLILHGRHVCQARKPHCYKCHIVQECHYDKKLDEAAMNPKK